MRLRSVALVSILAVGSAGAVVGEAAAGAPTQSGLGGAYEMAPPQFLPDVGPVPITRPDCKPDQIAATARLKANPYGVLGVVHMHGTKVYRLTRFGQRMHLRCALPMRHGPRKLLGPDGPLPVPIDRADSRLAPQNARSDLPLIGGRAIWGFSWLGSYCGPAATALVMPLTRGRTIDVPIAGPTPKCTGGRTSSALLDGVAGWPREPVQPPAPAFAGLRLSLRIEPGSTRRHLAPTDATLTDVGKGPIELSPCPWFGSIYSGTAPGRRSFSFAGTLHQHSLDCAAGPVKVTPGRPFRFTIPGTDLFERLRSGWTLSVEAGIGGVPAATASVVMP